VFGVRHVKIGVANRSVRVLDEPARYKVVQIIRNRTESNRFISRRLVNFPSLRKDGTGGCLRLRIGARELQAKYRKLAPYFPKKSQGFAAKPPTR